MSTSGWDTEYRYGIEPVDPITARWWLDRDPTPHRVSPRKVNTFKAAMAAGKWIADFEPIFVTWSDGVISGRHRCTAISEGDITVRTLIAREVDPAWVVALRAQRSQYLRLLAREATAAAKTGASFAERYELVKAANPLRSRSSPPDGRTRLAGGPTAP